MSQNLYPDVGTEFVSYSAFQLAKLTSLPENPIYLGGKISFSKNGITLWSQQAQFHIETNLEPVWENFEAKTGDWVAILLQPQDLKDWFANGKNPNHNLKLLSRAPRIKRLVGENASIETSSAPQIAYLRMRSDFVNILRSSLVELGLEELETPSLVPCPGMEPTLEPFSTNWKWGAQTKTFYLPTSPELHLKKLLAQGWTDIFEIKNCFRNSEQSDCHEPEFLMLEWYRAFKNLQAIKADLRQLLDRFFESGLVKGARPIVTEVTYANLFERFLKFPLKPDTEKEELEELCLQHNIHFTKTDSWDDLFFRLSLDQIEPQLVSLGPVIISNFPPSQAALARMTSDGWADRFEFYWQGLEIANAFHELNDPIEQARRFESEIQLRKHLGTAEISPDFEFLDFLRKGMPPAAGIALGVERLLMACQGETKLRKYRAFPFKAD